ncbi:hypothetical protein T31B1_05655 [Salinisphaera sp. T31B1]
MAALVLSVAAGAAVFFNLRESTPSLVFVPSAGDQYRYRVGNRVNVKIDGRSLDHKATAYGLVSYRVVDAGEPLHLHADIDLLDLQFDYRSVLSSLDLDPGAPYTTQVAEALDAGFDLRQARDGRMQITAVNKAAMQELTKQFDRFGGDPFSQAVLGPAVPPGIPAREGARVKLDGFQGFDGLTVTVDALDETSARLSVSGEFDTLAADSPLIQRMAPPTDAIEISDVRVAARMNVDREHGWIEDMTLVIHLRMAVGERAATMRSITYAHRDDHLLAGSTRTPLDGFSMLPIEAVQGSDLMQAQYSGVFAPPPMHEPPPRIEPIDSTQILMSARGHVMMYLNDGDTPWLPYGSLELQNATALDANGKPVDIPLAYNRMNYDDADGGGWLFDLVALGWESPELSNIAEVRADIGYRRRETGEPVTLVLDDRRHVLEHGDARAVAEPIAGETHAWRVTLTSGGQRQYWLDPTTLPDGVHGTGWVQDPDTWLTPADQIMLARTEHPGAWHNTLRIEADRPSLALTLLDAGNGRITQTETVRFTNPLAVAPTTRHIDQPPYSERDLSLAQRAPEPDGRGGLQMDLPLGLDGQCGLAAWVARPDRPVRLWRKLPRPDDAGPPTGMQRWQLTLADGAHADVSELPLDTILTCPGTPVWRSIAVTGDRPWQLDLRRLTGRWPQSTGSAADYFDHVQFLDANDQPLRPRLRGAAAEDTPGDWAEESRQHSVDDYVGDNGVIRIWGDVARVVMLDYEPPVVKKTWPNAARRRARDLEEPPS